MTVHLEQMERAGVPLPDSLQQLSLSHPSLRDVLQKVSQDVESGSFLSEALRKHPSVFDRVFLGLIQVGERTGYLAESLNEIQQHLQWVQELDDQIRNAIRYPLLMGSLLIVAFGLLLTLTVPPLVGLFLSLGQELPWVTQVLFHLSLFLEEWGIFLLPLLAVLGIICSVLYRSQSFFRNQINALFIKLPLFRSIQRDLACARFSHYLAHMCGHGVDLLDALRSASSSILSPSSRQRFSKILDQVSGGESLSNALRHSKLFPSLVVRMVAVGEETGTLPLTLRHVQQHFDRTAKTQIRRVVTYTEPILLCLAGLFLFLIVYSIFWPLYNTLSYVDL